MQWKASLGDGVGWQHGKAEGSWSVADQECYGMEFVP